MGNVTIFLETVLAPVQMMLLGARRIARWDGNVGMGGRTEVVSHFRGGTGHERCVDLNEARKGSNFFIEQAGGGGQATGQRSSTAPRS